MSYMGNVNKSNSVFFIRDEMSSNTKVTDINSGNKKLLCNTVDKPSSVFFGSNSTHTLNNTVSIPYLNTVRNIDLSGTRSVNSSYSDFFIKIRLNLSNIADTGAATLFGTADEYQTGNSHQAGSASVMNRCPRQRIALNKTTGLKSTISFNTVCNRDGLKAGSFVLQSIVLKD